MHQLRQGDRLFRGGKCYTAILSVLRIVSLCILQVNLLLLHQAVPTSQNKDKKSALDLACEFGRYRVGTTVIISYFHYRWNQEISGKGAGCEARNMWGGGEMQNPYFLGI